MLWVMLRNLTYYWRSTLAVIVILVLIGLAFNYTLQTSEQIKVEADVQLTEKWRTGYDLLISPTADNDDNGKESIELTATGFSSSDVLDGLVRRGDMANHQEGISLQHYETIKKIEGVQVAAPLSFIGYVENEGINLNYGIEEYGFYDMETSTKVFDGIRYRDVTQDFSSDISVTQYVNPKDEEEIFNRYEEILEKGQWGPSSSGLMTLLRSDGSAWSMVAIDPIQEAKLLQMDAAIVEGDFFKEHQELKEINGVPVVPLILLNQPYDTIFSATINKIEVPTLDVDQLIKAGGRDYLKTLPQENVVEIELNPFSEKYFFHIGEISLENGVLKDSLMDGFIYTDQRSVLDYSPLQFRQKKVELSKGVPVVEAIAQSSRGEQINYRNSTYLDLTKEFGFEIVGRFDATLLENTFTTSDKPVPPDYYRPENVYITHDTNGAPYEEPYIYESSPYKSGYYTGGIDAITTLVAAEYLLEEKPISIIRVIVEDVGVRNSESMAKVERVAQQIKEQTNLQVDIMLGSADRKVNVLLDTYENIPGYGYLLEGWSEEGASFVIEDRVSTTTLLLTLYILAMGLICLGLIYRNYTENRKRDISVLYTFGWSKWKIVQSLLLESSFILIFVLVCFGFLRLILGQSWGSEQMLYAILFSVALSVIVMISFYVLPIIRYMESNLHLRGGNRSKSTFLSTKPGETLWVLGFRNMVRHPIRSITKALIIITTLIYVTVFLISKNQASSLLMLTFLGENIDITLEPNQRLLFIIGILLALFSYVAIHINQTEARMREIQLYESWGWQTHRWASLYLLEEMMINSVSVCVGVIVSYMFLTSLTDDITFSLVQVNLYILAGLAISLFISAGTLLIRSKQYQLGEFH
ncbi:ABC transporter permease [Pseudogracilibacillus sp. SO30301A]|uniref:ABC transporter permease n=1 Tax=Pseudogracilibacillus sp. SO30301A TaxID=3098291 RepID=UPI00300E2BDD